MSIAKWTLGGAILLAFGASLGNAQTSFDVNLGFGSAWDSAKPHDWSNPTNTDTYLNDIQKNADPNVPDNP